MTHHWCHTSQYCLSFHFFFVSLLSTTEISQKISHCSSAEMLHVVKRALRFYKERHLGLECVSDNICERGQRRASILFILRQVLVVAPCACLTARD
jgi:hypothetical protein